MKWGHAAVDGVVDFTLRKNQDRVAAVDGFAGKAEALAKTGKLRERENVEQRGDQEIAELIGPALCEKPFARCSAHAAERFSSHGGGETVAKSCGECGEDETDIGAAGDVIGDDDGWAFEILQVVAADYAGVAEELGGGPDHSVIDDEAGQADGFALGPARVVIGGEIFRGGILLCGRLRY